MRIRTLAIIWAQCFLLCALLGFVPNPQGAVYGLLVAAAVLFFVPPAWMLFLARRDKNRRVIKILQILSLCSLGTTVVFLVGNLLTIGASAAAGKALYYMLIVVSSPMVCGQIWVISLFLWSCLFVSSTHLLKK